MSDQPTDIYLSRASFALCRFGVAALVWYSVLARTPLGLSVAFSILVASALLGANKSPLVLLADGLEKLLKHSSEKVPLYRKGMRFAHSAGATLSGIALLTWYFFPTAGWIITIAFALLKSVSAVGLCPAERLYRCVTSDTCCTFMNKWKK